MSQGLDDSPKSQTIRSEINRDIREAKFKHLEKGLNECKQGDKIILDESDVFYYEELIHDLTPSGKNFTGIPKITGDNKFVLLCTDEERWMY